MQLLIGSTNLFPRLSLINQETEIAIALRKFVRDATVDDELGLDGMQLLIGF